GLPAWGSFERWSAVVRESIVWAGQPDPADTRPRAKDATAATMGVILVGIERLIEESGTGPHGLLVRQIITRLDDEDPDNKNKDGGEWLNEMESALTRLIGAKPDAANVGRLLRQHRDRWFAGRRLVVAGPSGGSNRWRVEQRPTDLQGRSDV